MKMLEFWLKFHWSLFLDVIANKRALVQVMAWRQAIIINGDMPLSEPMLTQFTDRYMRH